MPAIVFELLSITHYFRLPIGFQREFFTKIHFRSIEKYSQPDKRDKLLPNQHEIGNTIVNKFLIVSTTN